MHSIAPEWPERASVEDDIANENSGFTTRIRTESHRSFRSTVGTQNLALGVHDPVQKIAQDDTSPR